MKAQQAQIRPADTADRILDLAERLVRTRGFNGFSYADIAAEVRVTKASLHYHFPTKADLGQRLIERYRETFLERLRAIDEAGDGPAGGLRRYVRLYVEAARDDRMCLCGMLAADLPTLPGPMQAGVRRFFETNEAWLAALLERGRGTKALAFAGSAADRACLLVSALEGGMLLARAHGDPSRLERLAMRLVADLDAGGAG